MQPRLAVQIKCGRHAGNQAMHDLEVLAPAQFVARFAEQHDAVSVAQRPVARPTGDVVALPPQRHQLRRHGDGNAAVVSHHPVPRLTFATHALQIRE